MALRTPEQLLAGRYRTIRRLGSGGMATVWLAEDERLGRRVAVKRLHGDVSDGELVRRFQREARLGASLNHPNVVAVYDIATDEEGVIIVMEYVEGRTLRDEIAAGPVPVDRALRVLRGVADALDHAHGLGVLHRDVKPANVLIRGDGTPKIADLGIATAAEQSRITRSGMVLGTAAYMAPERIDGGAGDRAADVYALAAVAFETLSGRKAVEGVTPLEVAHKVVHGPPPDLAEVRPGTPAAAADVLRRGLARDPAERPRSAGALIDELDRALKTAPTQRVVDIPPPGGKGGHSSRKAGRRGAIAAAALALLAAVIAVIALSGNDSTHHGAASRATHVAAKHHAAKPRPATHAAPPIRSHAAPIGDPATAVNAFYQHAASHDYGAAWAMTTAAAQRQLGGYASFARSQSTLRRISFPTLRTTARNSETATVQLMSSAVHTDRIDHVCGTVGLVRSSSGWLLNTFSLDTCPPAAVAPSQRKAPAKHKKFKPPKPSQARGVPGAEGGD